MKEQERKLRRKIQKVTDQEVQCQALELEAKIQQQQIQDVLTILTNM